jgi:hypothetical protein
MLIQMLLGHTIGFVGNGASRERATDKEKQFGSCRPKDVMDLWYVLKGAS